MFNQIYDCFDNTLFLIQCGLPKRLSAQYCLLVIIEKFKKATDRVNEFGVLMIGICINYSLIISKILSYGISLLSANIYSLMQSY